MESARRHDSTDAAAEQLPRHHVARCRLDELISSDERVTTVIAPAGSGKSVAVAGWALGRALPVQWVDARRHSQSRTSLWWAIADSFEIELTADGSHESARRDWPVGDVVLRLTEALRSLGTTERVLVVDGVDDVHDDSALIAWDLFLRSVPRTVRVIMLGRRQLPLSLDWLRIQGELLEVGFEDLAFTTDESLALFELLAPGADREFTASTVTLAAGWAAAIGLAARAWRQRRAVLAAPDLDVVRRMVGDYVHHQVLAGEDPSLVDFLIAISVVDTISAPLANAITARDDALRMLDEAERRLTFVSRVGLRGLYHVHPAFRCALLDEGERHDPQRIASCRRSAAGWHEQFGEPVVALELWLAAGETRAAMSLLADRQVSLHDAGLETTISEYAARVAHATVTDVAGMVELAWCQLLLDRSGFLRTVDEASWWVERGADIVEATRHRLSALVARASLVNGDLERCTTAGRAALAGQFEWWADPLVTTTWNDLARAAALDERWDDTSEEIREITVVVRREPNRALVVEATRALGAALAGRPIEALRVAAAARTSDHISQLTFARADLALAEVIALRELGDATDPTAELSQLVDLDIQPATYIRALAAVELVHAHLERGALTNATDSFAALRQIIAEQMPGPLGRTWLGRTGTLVALESGDVDDARRWADQVVDPFWGPIGHARVHAAIGHLDNAAVQARRAVPRSPRHEVVAMMLSAMTTRDRDESTALAEQAALVASSNGMLQTLASVVQLELIERAAWRLPEEWMVRLRRATANVGPITSAKVALVEPLTVRERDVLRFLPSRLTLKEIAAELFVSVNTLKFHLKVIYRKLGVNSRAEAAEIARSWGRIDS
jgi:LuxR family maltose regulon positive regulatory protein